MPWPPDLTTKTVTSSYPNAGAGLNGYVSFVLTADLADATAPAILRAAPIQAEVVGGVMAPIVLPCTDNADLSPSGFAWTATEVLKGAPTRIWSFYLPHTLPSTVDLADLTPLVTPPTLLQFLLAANNLSDLPNPAAARTALGLGSAATANIGTTAGTVASGADPRFPGSNNVKFYGATGTAKKITDAAITNGTATLTSPCAPFTAAVTGETVMVVGAGAAGLPLVATATYVNASTVTLAANASTTVTAATAWFGADDSTALQAAHTAVLNSPFGGAVYYPTGTYLTLQAIACTTAAGTPVRIMGDGPRASTLVAPASHAFDLGGNYTKGGFEIDHVAVVAYGGDVLHNANVNQGYIHHFDFQQYDPTHAIFTMTSTGSLILLTVDQGNSTVWTPSGTSRTVDAWSCVTSIGSGLANCTWERVNFQNYSSTANGAPDNAKYQIRLQATGSVGHHATQQHQAIRDCYFEQCFGGAIISLSGGGLTIDGCRIWDIYASAAFGNQTVGNQLIYIGKDPNGTYPSWRTTISNYGRDTTANGLTGATLFDIYLESTTLATTLIGLETRAAPAVAAPVYVNLNGADVVSIGHQWASAGNQNSGTTFANNIGASVLVTDGAVAASGSVSGIITPNTPQPSDSAYVSWPYMPELASSSTSNLALGQVLLVAQYIRASTTATGVALYVATGLGTGVAGENFIGLYNSAGQLVATSADVTSSFGTTGLKKIPFTAPQALAPGFYWAAVLSNGGTAMQVGARNTVPSGMINLGVGATAYRWGYAGGLTAQVALPASFTPANNTAPGAAFWAALY